MTGDKRVRESAVMGDREVEAAKEAAKKKAAETGKRAPQPQDTPEHERPQTQKLVVDGTDG